ncbi:cyclic AMP-responsive element-binding protein 3-like protein 3-B isoform X2 [Colossoma macropomum]|uniref:cyclic AMP-responsive element-binding protein 3-like protein 3-B isoform X2 n=1 Tax=Colossoma macropomum TaxID=42526 RepID=UPI00186426E4|nr:cyclic AMP-responsive element-binding protein 3-like protein 3-B isoform X2 [Colossoma macropomum]
MALLPDKFMCDSEDAAVRFLDSLLCVSERASDPGSPPWAPSPCDSGISEDPPSDQRDTPPPSSPLFHSFFHPQHLLPQAQPQQQLQQQQQAGTTMSSAEPDVSIDVASWESSMFSYRPVVPECVPTVVLSPQTPSVYQLSVKDLLLSSVGEAPKQACQNSLQQLILNDDEKKLLAKEGVCLPSQLPLTKYEEKILKKIRRKIRNKQSAQESRKKKKEYVDGLEGRMAACSAQNLELQKKVIQLEKTNTSLMEQLRRLQALVMNGSCKPAQTGTCILVLLLSFSLILFPSLQPVSLSGAGQPGDFTAARVQSRSLRSVLEVHSLQPVFSVDRRVETATSMITKMHIRPEYADMGSLPNNRSYGDEEHHHGDPITGHMATLGWLSRPDSGPYHQEDRK